MLAQPQVLRQLLLDQRPAQEGQAAGLGGVDELLPHGEEEQVHAAANLGPALPQQLGVAADAHPRLYNVRVGQQP